MTAERSPLSVIVPVSVPKLDRAGLYPFIPIGYPLRSEPESVAVGMPVTRHPPHRSPRAALPHEALILDAWRQSELWGMDGEHEAPESIDRPVFASAPSVSTG